MFAKGMDERKLKQKLANIPEREMLAYHSHRMKQYRVFFIVALGCGVLSVISIFVFREVSWISAIFAILGIIVLGWVSFQRERWKRLFENLLYLKRSQQAQQDTLDDQNKHYGKKFDQLKKEL